MDQLSAEDLYEEQGEVSLARPLLQGDIFAGVVIPGFGEQPKIVQVVTHPCSMRRGAALNERLQIVPVDKYEQVADWNQHGKVMPLPSLYGTSENFAGKFIDLTAVRASDLTLGKRIASLSHPGIHILQQRIVKHYTRVEIGVAQFREQSAPVLAEAEMQESWIETIVGDTPTSENEVALLAGTFQSWLAEDQSRRRTELESEANHARLRKETRVAALDWRAANR